MKLHDLHPAPGSHRARTRVGRGIAAGKGKTAGRGTKGQKSRAGSSIPAWFEGGQTPLHIRIPKLRGFRNINRVEFEVVNVGAIAAAIEAGRVETAPTTRGRKAAPTTVNADILRGAGLVRDVRRPLKVLGSGDLGVALFVVADAFTKSAREKIEAAGGTAQLIEVPSTPMAALGVETAAPAATPPPSSATSTAPTAAGRATPEVAAVADVAAPDEAAADAPDPDEVASADADASV